MHRLITKQTHRQRRHRRVRARVVGTPARPRISVFRSVMHVTAQVIDDTSGRTLAFASDREVAAPSGDVTQRKVAAAHAVGALLAERARANGVTAVVFDRGGYAYHGRVKAVADGAREGGLEF